MNLPTRLLKTLLPLLLATSMCAQKAERIELYYGIAEGNYLVGDVHGAATGIKQTLKINPDYLPALSLQARILLDLGDPEAALVPAERARSLAPQNPDHQLLQALVLGNLNRHADAAAIIQSVIAQSPPTSEVHSAANQLLGLLQMAEGDWDAAAESFNRIYLADPQSATTSLKLGSEAYLEKARRALSQRKHRESIDAIDQAIAVYQGKSGQEALQEKTALRLLRARVLAQIGDFNAAIADLQTLSGQQPENLEAAITLASLYASTERWASLQDLIPTLALQPGLQDIAFYFKGRAELAKGRIGSARENFEAGIALHHDGSLQPALHFYRGHCLHALNRKQEAQVEILQALDLDFRPESAPEAILAAQTLIDTKQAPRAIPILEAICFNTASAEAWALLGRAHQAAEAHTLAISAFNQSLTLDPDQAVARALRGSLLRQIGDLSGAATDYEAARILDPANPAYLYALGLVRLQRGELPAAEQNIGLAAHLLPENAGLCLLHALLAYAIDAPKTAQSALKQYFQLSHTHPNETAYFLDYALRAHSGLGDAPPHPEPPAPSPAWLNFRAYCAGQLNRKAVLDAAGKAESAQTAQLQMCEAAYWMAQHERHRGLPHTAAELLKLAVQIGHPDCAEFQFARWQLNPK